MLEPLLGEAEDDPEDGDAGVPVHASSAVATRKRQYPVSVAVVVTTIVILTVMMVVLTVMMVVLTVMMVVLTVMMVVLTVIMVVVE